MTIEAFIQYPTDEQRAIYARNTAEKQELAKLLSFVVRNRLTTFFVLCGHFGYTSGYVGYTTADALMDFVEKFDHTFTYQGVKYNGIWVAGSLSPQSSNPQSVDDLIREATDMFSKNTHLYLAEYPSNVGKLPFACPLFPIGDVEKWLDGE